MATSIWYQEFVAHRCTARRFPGRWRLHRRRHHRHRYRCRHQHEGWVDRCRRGKQERFSRPSRSTTAPIYLRAALSLSLSLSRTSYVHFSLSIILSFLFFSSSFFPFLRAPIFSRCCSRVLFLTFPLIIRIPKFLILYVAKYHVLASEETRFEISGIFLEREIFDRGEIMIRNLVEYVISSFVTCINFVQLFIFSLRFLNINSTWNRTDDGGDNFLDYKRTRVGIERMTLIIMLKFN